MKSVQFLIAAAILASGADPAYGQPCRAGHRHVLGVPVDVVEVDTADPRTVLAVGLAGQRSWLAPPTPPHGEARFGALVRGWHAAAAVNGTFFSLAPGRPVMGTLVTAGRLANHVAWRPKGAALSLGAAGMRLTTAAEAPWRASWLSLVGGPWLKEGGVRLEGIHDPDVLGQATRTVLGVDGSRLLLVSIGAPVSLALTAAVMRALGAREALNLDGGTSRALALGDRVLVAPGRPLTNALVVFDALHPAPPELLAARRAFRRVAARPAGWRLGTRTIDEGPFEAGRVMRFPRLYTGDRLKFEDWTFVCGAASAARNADGWLSFEGRAAARLAEPLSVLVAPAASPGTLAVGGVPLVLAVGRPPLLAGKAVGPALEARQHLVRAAVIGGGVRFWLDDRLLGRVAARDAAGLLTISGVLQLKRWPSPKR